MDIQKVIDQLESYEKILALRGQSKLAPFNSAYLLVTRNFQKAIQENFFSDSKTIEVLDVVFSEYYFAALKAQNMPREWQTVQARAVLDPSKLFSLLLGANVHINHDLPLAILKSIEDPNNFRDDFFKAQVLFKKSISEILTIFEPRSKDTFKGKIIFTFTVFVILRWRKNAWAKFLQLKENGVSEEDLQRLTLKKAKQIQNFEVYLARYGIF